jgi:hypothetical protein
MVRQLDASVPLSSTGPEFVTKSAARSGGIGPPALESRDLDPMHFARG